VPAASPGAQVKVLDVNVLARTGVKHVSLQKLLPAHSSGGCFVGTLAAPAVQPQPQPQPQPTAAAAALHRGLDLGQE
jgi:hypothetical protein